MNDDMQKKEAAIINYLWIKYFSDLYKYYKKLEKEEKENENEGR